MFNFAIWLLSIVTPLSSHFAKRLLRAYHECMIFDRVAYAKDNRRGVILDYINTAVRLGRIRKHPDARVDSDALYRDYLAWCQHMDWYPTTPSSFSAHLKGLGFPNGRGPTKVRGRRGLELVD